MDSKLYKRYKTLQRPEIVLLIATGAGELQGGDNLQYPILLPSGKEIDLKFSAGSFVIDISKDATNLQENLELVKKIKELIANPKVPLPFGIFDEFEASVSKEPVKIHRNSEVIEITPAEINALLDKEEQGGGDNTELEALRKENADLKEKLMALNNGKTEVKKTAKVKTELKK